MFTGKKYMYFKNYMIKCIYFQKNVKLKSRDLYADLQL